MPLYSKLRSMALVLVEDDAMLRDSMVLFFRIKGCLVRAFASAEEAIESFGVERPDIVISDNWLPGQDGLSLLKRLGEQHPDVIRVLITAYPSVEIAAEAKRIGIDEYILKPFSIEELERVLEGLLATRESSPTEGTSDQSDSLGRR